MSEPDFNKMITVMFHRAEHFYLIEAPYNDKWEKHVELNPGTLKITNALTGEVLWSLQ